jgi:prepilin-type processing-associated H-X9-DG protein
MSDTMPPIPGDRFGTPAGLSPAERDSKTSGAAVASLVLGVLSCGLTCLTGIPAIICGAIGLRAISGSEKSGTGPVLTGRGMAVTGLVFGCVMTVVPALVFPALLLPAVQEAREAARLSRAAHNLKMLGLALHDVAAASANNLKMIGLGMHNVAAASGEDLFPQAIVDENGRPLLSWRVALLPFLGDAEAALYEEFHLDEPWDSDHNRQLIARMPSVYGCPNSPIALSDGETVYLAAAGPGMALGEDQRPLTFAGAQLVGVPLRSFFDGTSRTILVVEVDPQQAVVWTKPEEFEAVPAEAAEWLQAGSPHPIGRNVLFADGSVQRLTDDLAPASLEALFTKSGGELIDFDY